MGEAAGTGVEGRQSFFVRAAAVPDLRHDAQGAQVADQVEVAGQFRRQGQHPDRGQGIQGLNLLERPRPRFGRLRPESAGADKRAFEMHAEHPRGARRTRAHHPPDVAQRVFEVGARRGHRRRQQAGRSMGRVLAGHDLDRPVAVHHVTSAAAMHMQVDEAGQDARLVGGGRRHGRTQNGLDPL